LEEAFSEVMKPAKKRVASAPWWIAWSGRKATRVAEAAAIPPETVPSVAAGLAAAPAPGEAASAPVALVAVAAAPAPGEAALAPVALVAVAAAPAPGKAAPAPVALVAEAADTRSLVPASVTPVAEGDDTRSVMTGSVTPVAEGDDTRSVMTGSVTPVAEAEDAPGGLAVGSVVVCLAKNRPQFNRFHAVVRDVLKNDVWVEVFEGPAASLSEKERSFKIRKTHVQISDAEGALGEASPGHR
jgi:hypothetical protein